MRTALALAAVALSLTAAGCEPVPSINPLVPEGQAAVEPALAGTWRSLDPEEKEVLLRFEPAEEGSFKITYTAEEGKSSLLEGRLMRLEDRLYLDAYPSADRAEELFAREAFFPVIPVHTFYRIEIAEDRLRLSWLDDTKLREQLKQGKVDVAHETIQPPGWGTYLVLTASTRDLQALVRAHPEVFGEAEEFARAQE